MTATNSDVSQRLGVVDALRGFALCGLFLVHMIESYELDWVHPEKGLIADTVFLLFLGKSFSLLAMCFGFSFYILMERAARRGVDFTARFAWRLLMLALIGYCHSLIYRGDIIMTLAAMGLLLLGFHRIRDNRVLAGIAIVCLLGPSLIVQMIAAAKGAAWANVPTYSSHDPGMPVYLHGDFWDTLQVNLWPGQVSKYWFFLEYGRLPEILGLYLTGMVLGRIGFFGRIYELRWQRRAWMVVALAVAAILWWYREDMRTAYAAYHYGAASQRAFWTLTGIWLELAGTAFWALLVMEAYQWAAKWMAPLAAMGRLTLTYYIGQSIVFVPLFYNMGAGLHDDWGQATRLYVALFAIAVQMVGAVLWFRYFAYGPLEWVWRAATYRTFDVPFRRKHPVAVEPAPPTS